MDITRAIYEATKRNEKHKVQKTVRYDSKLDGYVTKKAYNLEKILVAKTDDFYRYLAGERKHLYPEYDDQLHFMEIEVRQPELMVESGVPIGLYDTSIEKVDNLPPGFYRLEDDSAGIYLKKISMPKDKYIEFRENDRYDIYGDLKIFRESRSIYEKNNVRHKSGVLLYGPPGNGKTRHITKILENCEKDDLIAIYIPSKIYDLGVIEGFKQALSGKDVVFILEEITERAQDEYKLEELLSLLDGELSWDNMYVIATTNYPEKLPANVVDRPGRFNRLVEFKDPNANERRTYIQKRLPKVKNLEEIVEASKDLSIDYLTQAIIQSQVRKVSILDYLKDLRASKKLIKDCFKENRQQLGLG